MIEAIFRSINSTKNTTEINLNNIKMRSSFIGNFQKLFYYKDYIKKNGVCKYFLQNKEYRYCKKCTYFIQYIYIKHTK